jgi:hypothetical protein
MRGARPGHQDRIHRSPEEVTFVKIEIRQVEDIKATSVHQEIGAGGA